MVEAQPYLGRQLAGQALPRILWCMFLLARCMLCGLTMMDDKNRTSFAPSQSCLAGNQQMKDPVSTKAEQPSLLMATQHSSLSQDRTKMKQPFTQRSTLCGLLPELLNHIATYLDLQDMVRLRATYNRLVVAKTEHHYAKLLVHRLRKGVWLSVQTIRTLEAISNNPVIAPLITHIDFNVLYLPILYAWRATTSSSDSALYRPDLSAFIEEQRLFFDHENFEDDLGRTLRAFPALSSVTTTSTHSCVNKEGNIEHWKPFEADLRNLRRRFKLEGLEHIPWHAAPSTDNEFKIFRAAAKAGLQPTEVSFCALPLDLLSYPLFLAKVERCQIFGVENHIARRLPTEKSDLNRVLDAMPRLRTLHLQVGWLKWKNIFGSKPYSLLDWGHPADLSLVRWPMLLEQLMISHLDLGDKEAFLRGLPRTVGCELINAKYQADNMGLCRSEKMYNFCCFG